MERHLLREKSDGFMKKGETSRSVKSDETVKVLRIHKIDDEIRSGTFPNVPKLAALFEVSERTINRDLDIMRDQFLAPIEYDRIHNGYYYTNKDFYIKYIPLQEGELFSLALFDTLLVQYKNTPLESSLKNIFKKIIKSLPDKVKVESCFLSDVITCISDPLPFIDQDLFSSIINASDRKKTVTFKYKPLQKTTYMERTLDPFHIVCQRGNWYVIGWCHYSKEIRIFSFSRISEFHITEESFTIPQDFNLHDHIDTDVGVWVTKIEPFAVKLLFAPEVGTFAAEHQWHEKQTLKVHDDGSVQVTFETTQMQEVKRWVLGQGTTVTVLEPPELIQEIKEDIQKLGKLYGIGEEK